MNKKIILLFLSSLLGFPSLISGLDFASAGQTTSLMPGGAAGEPLFQMPTPEEMAQIEEFLNSLTPEEMDELAKIGEQIIKEAEAEGRPLFPNMPIPQPPVTVPRAPEPTIPVEKPSEATPESTEKKINKEKMEQSAKQTVIQLIEIISTLRQKAETDERYVLHFNRITPSLNILVYYLHVMRDSKHVNHLTDEEFVTLKNEIISLKNDLVSMVRTLIIPSPLTEKKLSKYEREQRRNAIITAERTVHDCASRIEQSLVTKNLLQECEKLLKKYEPEAVKLKEEQARRAKLALEQSAKTQATSNKLTPIPTFSMKTSQYAAPNRGSSTGSTVPSSYANERNQGYDFGPNTGGSRKPTGKTNGQKPGAEGAKTEGSEKLAPLNEVEKSTKKMNERFVELRNNIKKADGTIRTRQESIKPLFENSGITRESDPAAFKAVRLALDEIVHDVTQAHESYKEWSKDLGDYAKKSGGGFREKQKQLSNYKRLIENEARSIEELTHYLDALETRSEISEEKVDIFYDHIKEIKDKYAKLTEKITSNEDLPVEPRKKKKKSVKAESPTTPGTKGLITPSETKITSIPLPDSSSDQPSPDMQETDTVQNYNS